MLTGETGAGKSILIDALAMVLGERERPRRGPPRHQPGEIAAEFDLAGAAALEAWLAVNDLAGDADVCLLRRMIDVSGRSRAFLNGHSCTLAQRREAGEFLVDIYGQHAHQSLLRPVAQRSLLDGYGGLDATANEVAQRHRHWRELAAQFRALDQDAARVERERDEVSFRVRELEVLQLAEGEWEALQQDHKRLAHAASLLETAQTAFDVLAEGDAACLPQLSAVTVRVSRAVDHDPRLRDVLGLLESAQNELQEAVHSLRDYGSRIDLDPGRLAEVDRRLEAIHDAARKYRVAPAELPELLQRSRTQLETLTAELDPETIRREAAKAWEAYVDAARELSEQRQRCAPQLSDRVTGAMQELAMAGGRFEVALTALDEGGAQGLEEVEFRVFDSFGDCRCDPSLRWSPAVSCHASAWRSRRRRANSNIPTLVFDEVDAGIGGGVAEILGRMLKNLGRKHQVMCVTHLPQVAACGDDHWRVAKTDTDAGLVSEVTGLRGKSRVEEVARMLGGVEITPTTRKHAEEMLALARQTQKREKGEKRGETGKT